MRGSIQSCPTLASSSSATSLDHTMFPAMSVPLYADHFIGEEFQDGSPRDGIISAPCTDRALSHSDMMRDFYQRTVSLHNVGLQETTHVEDSSAERDRGT